MTELDKFVRHIEFRKSHQPFQLKNYPEISISYKDGDEDFTKNTGANSAGII